MILYRPVGLQELALIYDDDFAAFPPRLPEQPIFYPVLNRSYAEQIARDWNTKSNSFAGYDTEFNINDQYVAQFEKHIVGGSDHEELWIPAESLFEFNRHIKDKIFVVDAFFGESFVGFIPDKYGLKGKNAVEQLASLTGTFDYNGVDFYLEIMANSKAVFLNYRYWVQTDSTVFGLNDVDKKRILKLIEDLWQEKKPEILLK